MIKINNSKFTNCLFEVTNIVKNSNEEKYVYSGHGVTFDSEVHGVLIMTLLEML